MRINLLTPTLLGVCPRQTMLRVFPSFRSLVYRWSLGHTKRNSRKIIRTERASDYSIRVSLSVNPLYASSTFGTGVAATDTRAPETPAEYLPSRFPRWWTHRDRRMRARRGFSATTTTGASRPLPQNPPP